MENKLKLLKVNGECRLEKMADRASARLTLSRENAESAALERQLSQACDVLMNELSIRGVGNKAETSGLELTAVYRSDEKGNRQSLPEGYRGEMSIRLITAAADVGKVFAAAAAAGAELQIGFCLADKRDARQTLLRGVIEDAREKAEMLAAAAGVSLKGIVEIEADTAENAGVMRMAALTPPPETISLSARARVVFELN